MREESDGLSERRAANMLSEAVVRCAINLLLDAAPAGSRVILFGSYARGDANDQSDLDFLVVEPDLKNRRRESVRLRQVLRPLGVPVDVLVVSDYVYEAWRDQPNSVLHEAAREGQVFNHVAA